MTEELKQKAIDFIKKTKATNLIRRTREREYRTVSDYSDKELETIYKTEIGLMTGFATEATKELQEEFERAKEIIREFMRITEMVEGFEPDYSELIAKAEAFLKEHV